tara:strand:+ start:8333 stop:11611 length:3279 start_codon:yes stop_codon:yes gene_type:complete
MASLTSPGVSVSVIDESFYTPAEPGTTPLLIVASAENKTNSAGTGTAPGTLKANAGKVYLLTSQRDLAETFGDPKFYTDTNNNPIHGGEQNEYGLQAAYSYLGVSNKAYVTRADIDLASLTASSTATTAAPDAGTNWFDTASSQYGIFEWNGAAETVTGGQTFTNKIPTVITDASKVTGGAPKSSVGAVGDYAIVATTTTNKLYYKNSSGSWVQVGSNLWRASHATVTGTSSSPTLQAGSKFVLNVSGSSATSVEITLSGTSITTTASDINTAMSGTGCTAAVVDSKLAIFNNGQTSEILQIVDGLNNPMAACGITEGTYYAPKLQISKHTDVPAYKTADANTRPTGSIWLKTTEPNLGARWRVKTYNATTSVFDTVNAPIYATNHQAIFNLDKANGGTSLLKGDMYIQSNIAEEAQTLATFKIFVRAASGATTITSSKITATTLPAGTYTFSIQESLKGQEALSGNKVISFTSTGATTDSDVVAGKINEAGMVNVSASVDSQNKVVITHKLGGDIRFVDTDNSLTLMGFVAYNMTTKVGTANLYWTPGETDSNPEKLIATLWQPLVYTASATAPTALAANGALWYSSVVDEVDMMWHNGTTWVGYLDSTAYPLADPKGPIVSASEPVNGSRSDKGNLVTGDIWISTADLENYPLVYVYNATTAKWVLIDNTDQTTENGILFADARYNTTGANSGEAGDIDALITSNYLDPDAPDPALYPKGMLLWNTRRSGFNVKKFVRNHITTTNDNTRFNNESMSGYYTHRWVTESANNTDGSGSFGRKAQRKVVVQALQSLIVSNQDIRDDETRIFNLIACPGYAETIGEMVSLNFDRGITAFVIGDSPFRLASDATSLSNWATNVSVATEDNDVGAVTRDEYLGMYYPSGFTSDNSGKNVVVPPSHMVLRTMALNDQVAFPWFAPAGTRRGGVNNASSVGFINSEGEFSSIALNEGQRDTLYTNNINPITFLTGAGLTVFGQKTRAKNASALDRINVARLTVYLRSQLNKLAKPYLFEPNDKITRDEIKQQIESLLVELVGLRALFDFLVVCDETNNTPARIDRNELYVDIAVEPVKAVEFIYIPLRLKNTGEIAGL